MFNINVADFNQKKILLVDDEKDILNLLETVLIKEGFKNIYKAENGNKAIELCISQVKSDPLRNLILIHLIGFKIDP
ncbi:DNA-binding response regulator, partial [Bacillaceae bacterium YX66]